jgi:hypothetical protein
VGSAEQVGGPVRERAVPGDQVRVRLLVTFACSRYCLVLFRLVLLDRFFCWWYTAGTGSVPPV